MLILHQAEWCPFSPAARERLTGPLLVRGNLRIVGADGKELARLDNAALRRYGHSSNKPLCDGTHERVGFQDDSR